MVEERGSTPRGAQALAAAKLAIRVIRLIWYAKGAARITSKVLADRLGVTEGRVSQVINGDGNVHIATLARFMHAMGYEVQIKATPISAASSTPTRVRRRGGADQGSGVERDYDIFEQNFLTGHGPMRIPMFVPTDDSLGCAPEGALTKVGRIRVKSWDEGVTGRVSVKPMEWQTEARTALVSK